MAFLLPPGLFSRGRQSVLPPKQRQRWSPHALVAKHGDGGSRRGRPPFSAPPAPPASSAPSSTADVDSLPPPSRRFFGTRALGVDYGLRRTGLAAGVGYASRPLPRVTHGRSPHDAAVAVASAATGVRLIVVGLPLNGAGAEGDQCVATRRFVARLVAEAPWAAIWLYDERWSSQEGGAALAAAGGAGGGTGGGGIDSAAAAVVLDRFFDTDGVGGECVAEARVAAVRGAGSQVGEAGGGGAFGDEKDAEGGGVSFAQWKREAMKRATAGAEGRGGTRRRKKKK